uniref:hypothetical protein n=1 Tax=Halomonas sp. TaxID=1486246 RepID=UPI00263978C2|nr:hypothetical protein [Halomonas sp.]
MAVVAPPSSSADTSTRRAMTRLWLAGLLVGCLLPAGLAQSQGTPFSDRLVQICIMAPAMIRARSVLNARRRFFSSPLWTRRLHDREIVSSPRSEPWVRLVAALDVVSRRGPPLLA